MLYNFQGLASFHNNIYKNRIGSKDDDYVDTVNLIKYICWNAGLS